MKVCNREETLATLNDVLSRNPELFTALPNIPNQEVRVLDINLQSLALSVLWGGLGADIISADIQYEVAVQLKCLYEQMHRRRDGLRDWSCVIFFTVRNSEQFLHRILLKRGMHNVVVAMGGCDC